MLDRLKLNPENGGCERIMDVNWGKWIMSVDEYNALNQLVK